jgi:uncharacterized membrane protein YdfJ with MMPL/SSD domain
VAGSAVGDLDAAPAHHAYRVGGAGVRAAAGAESLDRVSRQLLQHRFGDLRPRCSRYRETGADGLTKTVRVITAAAAIMLAVFLALAVSGEISLKLLGVDMATAVFFDATSVRMCSCGR